MSARRLVGILLALTAVGGGVVAGSRTADSARLSGDLQVRAETDALMAQALEAVAVLPKQLVLPSAQGASKVPQLQALITGADAQTLADFMHDEPAWSAFRAMGTSALYFSDALIAKEGDEALATVAAKLAHDAQATNDASAFIAVSGKALIASAALIGSTPNGQPASVALLRPLTAADLKPVADKLKVVLTVRSGDADAVSTGSAPTPIPPGTQTPQWHPCCASAELSSGLHLALSRDVTARLAAVSHAADTTKTNALIIGAMLAVIALVFGFWPRGKSQALLEQTTDELRKSRQQLLSLSQRLEAATGAPAGPIDDTDPSKVLLPREEHSFGNTAKTEASSRYEVIGQLGEGGMARVYVAVVRGAEGFRRYFVLKRLRPELINNAEAVNQFIDEGRMGASLVQSNIVPVFDFGRDAEGYFLAQEYILGRTVERLVRANQEKNGAALPPPVVLFIAQAALQALSYAHTKKGEGGQPLGLVHRDVSPANLMVSERGEVKLLDFGIVKSEERLTKTQAGMVKGNLYFMAPEQARGLSVDARADLFSLGMVLYTAATGDTIYTGETSYALVTRAGGGLTAADFARVRLLPAPLGPLLEKALRTDPNERYASADEFARAVASAGKTATAGEMQALMHQLFSEEFAAETASLREQTPQ